MSEKIKVNNQSEGQSAIELATYEQLTGWNDRKYQIETSGEKFSVVILGEDHYDTDMHEKQIELITIIRPEYVLHEALKGWIYDPATEKFEKQQGRRFFNEGSPDAQMEESLTLNIDPVLARASKDVGFKIVGCDLTGAETISAEREIAQKYPDRFTYDEEIQLLEKNDDSDWISTPSQEMAPFRDGKIVQVILAYHGQGRKPLFTIVGAAHGRRIHDQELLKGKVQGYAFVDQTEKR